MGAGEDKFQVAGCCGKEFEFSSTTTMEPFVWGRVGSHSVVLRDHSWQCLRDHIGGKRSSLVWLCARQAPNCSTVALASHRALSLLLKDIFVN